jgi:hypothetical protein
MIGRDTWQIVLGHAVDVQLNVLLLWGVGFNFDGLTLGEALGESDRGDVLVYRDGRVLTHVEQIVGVWLAEVMMAQVMVVAAAAVVGVLKDRVAVGRMCQRERQSIHSGRRPFYVETTATTIYVTPMAQSCGSYQLTSMQEHDA